MVDRDDLILAKLRDDYGSEWFIGRTFLDRAKSQPHWWKANRKRQLTRREEYKGLARTVIGDTAADLQTALQKEAELSAMIAIAVKR
ncbi:MAG: hypothetical protein ACRDOO_14010 [Actinomadura sp.]